MKKRMSKQKKLVIALALANGINVFSQTAYAATTYVIADTVTGIAINNGDTQIVAGGGTANTCDVMTGAVQNIANGGKALYTDIYGGTQNVNYGGTSEPTSIHVGGTQNVNNGGKVTKTIIDNGARQNVNNGGKATTTSVAGGAVQFVANGGTVVDTSIYSGVLKGELQIQETAAVQGTTKLNGGIISLVGDVGNYQIDKLVANGGTVNLAKGETLGRNLNFDSVSGSTNFRINTDLINKKADYITIKSADAPAEHTVQVNYDPTFDTGKSFVGSTPFATVPKDTSFKGLNSEYGAYVFEPTLASSTGADSTVWSIEKFKLKGEVSNPTPSESVKTAADLVHSSLLLGRVHNNNLIKRMGDLRQAHGEAGVWARMYTGEQEIANDGARDTQQKFTAMQAGYDQRIVKDDGVWYVGGALGYLNGKSTFERGNGTSKDMAVAAYGSWMGNKGHFLDVIAKVGRLDNEFTSYLNNSNNTMVSGNYKNWGKSLTVEYGYKQQLANDFYVEPQAEISLNRVNSANFNLSDGTNARIPSVSSFVGRLGVAVGKKVGDTNYYGKVSFLKEFKADGAVSMQNGGLPTVSLQQNLQENWLEYAVGVTTVLNKSTNGYLELTRTTGDKVRTPWQVNIGARWNF